MRPLVNVVLADKYFTCIVIILQRPLKGECVSLLESVLKESSYYLCNEVPEIWWLIQIDVFSYSPGGQKPKSVSLGYSQVVGRTGSFERLPTFLGCGSITPISAAVATLPSFFDLLASPL